MDQSSPQTVNRRRAQQRQSGAVYAPPVFGALAMVGATFVRRTCRHLGKLTPLMIILSSFAKVYQ